MIDGQSNMLLLPMMLWARVGQIGVGRLKRANVEEGAFDLMNEYEY